MKTADLIGVLAAGAGPAPRAVAARRLVPVMLAGLVLAACLTAASVGFVPMGLLLERAMWVKLAYPALLALAGGWLVARLSRPTAPAFGAWCACCGVVAGMLLLGLLALAGRPDDSRMAYVLGRSSLICSLLVVVLALPSLAGVLWAMRGLAPTRLRLAGFAAGSLAGAVGALAYSLGCTELSYAFVATWYTLGILLTAGIGTMLGPRWLGW